MVTCLKCGTTLESDSVTCPVCGSHVSSPTESVLAISQDPRQQLSSRDSCPWCGKPVLGSISGCPWCGKPVNNAPPLLAQTPSGPLSAPPQPWSHPPEQGPPQSHKKYKIVIAVLLISVIGLSAILAASYIANSSNSSALSKNPYATIATDTSSNWSGYKMFGPLGSIAYVQGSWVVPDVKCPSNITSTQLSDAWVGIDGVRNDSSTIEQIGTESGCEVVNGSVQATFFAWFEWYPGAPLQFTKPLAPGDTVTARVSWDGTNFVASIEDTTRLWSISERNSTIGSMAHEESAEWIVEAPSKNGATVPLADFGKVLFSNCRATISGVTGPMGSFYLVQETMIDSNSIAKARPVLPFWNDGTQFSIWWLETGP